MASISQIKICINIIAPLAIAQFRKGKKILPSVCIAQACLESGYLTSPKMKNANAVFGIKVGKNQVHFGNAWRGMGYSTKTNECYNGKDVVIVDLFRAYNSIADSVEDYYDMLISCSRYRAAVGEMNYVKAISAIRAGGYATDPNYVNKICKIIVDNNLTQFDGVTPGSQAIQNLPYIIGRTYTLQANMYVRVKPAGDKVKHELLTENGKEHAEEQPDGAAIMSRGTRVTCKECVAHDGAWWIKTPSGYICAIDKNGKVYIA